MSASRVVAASLAAVLVALSALHFYWLLGGRWGGANAVPEVAGHPVFRPHPLATFLVASGLLLSAFVAALQGGLWFPSPLPSRLVLAASVALGLVFTLRAIGDFRLVGFFKTVTGTTFARLDYLVFSPISLFLGICFLWISVQSSGSGRPSPLQ